MRLFIAIDIPEEIKKEIVKLQEKLPEFKGKLTEEENLHLTLKFLGEVNENKLEEIESVLDKIKFKKFRVYLNELGFFPNENYIRIIWVDLKPTGEIIELQQKIDGELLNLFSKDQRFQTHLTLGRVKFFKNKKEFLEKIKDINLDKLEFEINSFKLIKSELSKDGPKYIILKEFKAKD